jgi:predicted nucleic acid-binding protein
VPSDQSEARYFLDSTTLIHAIDKDVKYKRECLSIIGKATRGEIDAATSLETLEETLFILSKLTSAPVEIRLTRDYLRMTKLKKHEMSLSIL